MQAVVIFDFDNFFHGELNSFDGPDGAFNKVFDFIISELTKNSEIDFIHFRFYGGWYFGENLTNRSSEILRRLTDFNLKFPLFINRRKIEGSFILAQNQIRIPFIWKNTYREHSGLPKFRIDDSKMSPLCTSNKSICPVQILKHFAKKTTTPCHVPECSTTHGEVFKLKEQKMIDTMMACDIIAFTLFEDKPLVAIVSDDVDLFPSIALRHQINCELSTILFIKNQNNVATYSSIINQFNANVILTPYE